MAPYFPEASIWNTPGSRGAVRWVCVQVPATNLSVQFKLAHIKIFVMYCIEAVLRSITMRMGTSFDE